MLYLLVSVMILTGLIHIVQEALPNAPLDQQLTLDLLVWALAAAFGLGP
ncbi:MAG: hypothetical protein BMS9Abin02_0821 [Anaerolineae bacterium]|nr:MAG: hypothetical protein BMS9Abin02_0821 [Anaerolineae bacterium]